MDPTEQQVAVGLDGASRQEPRTSVVISVGGELFGLPLEHVEEVVRMARLGRLPSTQPDVLGCLNLRGEHVLVLDLLSQLGRHAEPIRSGQVLVLVRCAGRRVALRASGVEQVLALAIEPLPEHSRPRPYVIGLLRGSVPPVALIDLSLLLRPALDAAGECPGGADVH